MNNREDNRLLNDLLNAAVANNASLLLSIQSRCNEMLFAFATQELLSKKQYAALLFLLAYGGDVNYIAAMSFITYDPAFVNDLKRFPSFNPDIVLDQIFFISPSHMKKWCELFSLKPKHNFDDTQEILEKIKCHVLCPNQSASIAMVYRNYSLVEAICIEHSPNLEDIAQTAIVEKMLDDSDTALSILAAFKNDSIRQQLITAILSLSQQHVALDFVLKKVDILRKKYQLSFEEAASWLTLTSTQRNFLIYQVRSQVLRQLPKEVLGLIAGMVAKNGFINQACFKAANKISQTLSLFTKPIHEMSEIADTPTKKPRVT